MTQHWGGSPAFPHPECGLGQPLRETSNVTPMTKDRGGKGVGHTSGWRSTHEISLLTISTVMVDIVGFFMLEGKRSVGYCTMVSQ